MNINNLANAQKGLPARMARAAAGAAASLARLSSGLRLQRASDDVAALSISTQMQMKIGALRSAANNIAQASSLLQVADGGLQQIDGIAQRMKSLSTLALSGAITAQERAYLNLEFQQLKQEMGRLADETNFNGVRVLNGGYELAPPPPADADITGTASPETLRGGDGNDTIQPLDGDDHVLAGDGDDLIESGVTDVPGLKAEFFDSAAAIPNLAAFVALIGAQAPDGTFISTALDYVPGPTTSSTTTIGTFLGTDGATISNPALLPQPMNTAGLRFTGLIRVDTPGTYSFTTSSDDGFQLTIGGNTFSQFPGLRGFSGTTDSITLTAGMHSFELLYFENAAQEGLEVRSSLVGGGLLTSAVLLSPSSLTDGNDTIDGGEGLDSVMYSGNRTDYIITDLGNDEFSITDSRVNSPNGTDRLKDVETLIFADGSFALIPQPVVEEPDPGVLNFQVGSKADQIFSYRIVDATLPSLFEDPDALAIDPIEMAQEAMAAMDTAINRITGHRAYVGSRATQAVIIAEAIDTSIRVQGQARAVLADTDIAKVSTDYVMQVMKSDMSVLVAAQTNTLQRDAVLGLVQDATQLA